MRQWCVQLRHDSEKACRRRVLKSLAKGADHMLIVHYFKFNNYGFLKNIPAVKTQAGCSGVIVMTANCEPLQSAGTHHLTDRGEAQWTSS